MEHNWEFHYFLIRNKRGEPVIATFFTEALAKDDMFAPAEISRHLEKIRKQMDDPYYLSSRTLTMGCLLSVGKHIYINKALNNWKTAFVVMLEAVQALREEKNIPVLSLRDFDSEDELMKTFLIDLGLKRVNIPDGHVIDHFDWNTRQEFIDQLKGGNSKSTHDRRNYIRKRAFAYEDRFEVNIVKSATAEERAHYRRLYLGVSDKSYEIIGFMLHEKFFENVVKHPKWDILELKLKPKFDSRKDRKAVGISLSYQTDDLYSFLVTGIDYDYLSEHNVYTQILWQTIKRAKELKLKINLGITASQPKRKFGAKIVKYSIYVQNKDTFKDMFVNLLPHHESNIL